MIRKIIFLIFSVLLISEAHADKFIGNLKYGSHERNTFDIWLPSSKVRTPLIIYIHGGGWVQGDKNTIQKHQSIIKSALKNGFALASINYRFLKHAPLQTIMKEDIGGFVQFIRHQAEKFNLNKKVFAMGHSAGGSASLWLGTHPDLARSKSSTPEKRESSRLSGFAHLNAQFSYDFLEWYDQLGKKLTDKHLKKQVWERYHLKKPSDLTTREGEAIRSTLNSYANISKDDAPMFVSCTYAEKDIETANYDYFVHGPHHARLLARKAAEVGLKLQTYIKADGDKGHSDMKGALEFFKKLKDK